MSCVKNYGLLHLSEPRGWRGWGAIKINTTGGPGAKVVKINVIQSPRSKPEST